MSRSKSFTTFIILFFALFISASIIPAGGSPEEPAQDLDPDKCFSILEMTAERMGWNPESYTLDRDSFSHCRLDYESGGQKIHIDLSYDIYDWETDCACTVCQDSDVCECINFHGNEGEYMPGSFLRSCDPFCKMSFSVEAVNDASVDFFSVAEALHVSAEEVGCFQLTNPPDENPDQVPTEDTPGYDQVLPPDDGMVPDAPPDGGKIPPGDEALPGSGMDVGKIARNPLLPLSGALLGTGIGGLIAILRVLFPFSKPVNPSPFTPPQPVSPPPPQPVLPDDPEFWVKWEQNLPPPPLEINPAEPLPNELRTIPLDLDQAKATILDQYRDEIPSWRQELMSPERVHFLSKAEFDQHYEQTEHKKNENNVPGLMDPNTLEIFIDRENCQDFTIVHEALHLNSNPEYSKTVKTGMDEATTEYFTLKLAGKHKKPRSSLYTINDSTKVIDELVRQVGEPAVRKAFFADGRDGINELRRLVDQRLRPGAFDKVADLMQRDKNLEARELLRGTNIHQQSGR